jgi:hypothetical protein
MMEGKLGEVEDLQKHLEIEKQLRITAEDNEDKLIALLKACIDDAKVNKSMSKSLRADIKKTIGLE